MNFIRGAKVGHFLDPSIQLGVFAFRSHIHLQGRKKSGQDAPCPGEKTNLCHKDVTIL